MTSPQLLSLTIAAAALVSCKPLNGVDPLDSGELAQEAANISSGSDRLDENAAQDERMKRYEGSGLRIVDPDPELRTFGGVNSRSDF